MVVPSITDITVCMYLFTVFGRDLHMLSGSNNNIPHFFNVNAFVCFIQVLNVSDHAAWWNGLNVCRDIVCPSPRPD